MKTRRDKIAPKALLAPRKERLADLADRVLTLMYGTHAETALLHRLMHQPATVVTDDSVVGDDDEVIALVKSQIVCALSASQIVLAVEIDTTLYEERSEPYADLGEFALVDDDDKFDFSTEWVIAPKFWEDSNSAALISWSDSTIQVATDCIYKSAVSLEITPPFMNWHPLSKRFKNLPTQIIAKTYVANPDVALRRFFQLGPLPNEHQAADYHSSISNLVKEATAAAWRYLAVTSAGRDFNQRALMRQMIDYLKERNLYDEEDCRPSENVLLVVAGKIHKQFELNVEELAKQPVYVSSTPESSKPARPRKARGVRASPRRARSQ